VSGNQLGVERHREVRRLARNFFLVVEMKGSADPDILDGSLRSVS